MQFHQCSHAQGWKRMMPSHRLQGYWLQSGLGQPSKQNKKRQKNPMILKAKVFHLLLGMIQLSPLTPGQCWHGSAAVTAGKVTHPFSQQHSPANHPLHCSAKPQHPQEGTITSGSHRLSPPPSPHGRDNWYQQHHTPPSRLTTAGTSICQCLSPQVIRLLCSGDSQLEYGGSCSHVLVPRSDFSSTSSPDPMAVATVWAGHFPAPGGSPRGDAPH